MTIRRKACIVGAYEHPTRKAPDKTTAQLHAECARGALADAGLGPEAVDYVNAHGTGTPNNDASESAALRRLFGDRVPPFSSTKSFTGHTTSASGAIETVICLLALRHQLLPVNLNWHEPMEKGLRPVVESRPQGEIRHVLCNSFGFGGNDSSLLLSRKEES